MPPVFVVPGLNAVPEGGACGLPTDEAAHARRVLRLRAGDAVGLIDGNGLAAEAVVEDASPSGVSVRVCTRSRPEPPMPRVRVVAAPPKGARAESMVDGLAQLGVFSWTPLLTERGNPDGAANRRRRWERAALEAAKQCGRATLLRVEPALTLTDALARPAAGLRVLADPAGGPPVVPAGTDEVDLLIGPEGGFTDAERNAALAAGAIPWRLGPHILRIETAALAGAALATRGPNAETL